MRGAVTADAHAGGAAGGQPHGLFGFELPRGAGVGARLAGDFGEPLVGGDEVVIGEGLHHVLGGDGGAADFAAVDGGVAFECESVRRLRAARAR